MPQQFSYGRLVAEIALLSNNCQDEADEIRLDAAIRELDSIYAGVVEGVRAVRPNCLPARHLPECDAEAIDAAKLLRPIRRRLEQLIEEFSNGRQTSPEAAIRECKILLAMIPTPTNAGESESESA